jgi:hypothetical protein
MKKFIIRLLRLLVRLGIIGKVVSFTYKGEGLSLNKFYSQGHWRTRQSAKEEYRKKFEKVLEPAKGKYYFEKFYMIIFYNSRHDVDNVIGMEKVFADCLKGQLVPGDGKVNYKGILIFYDKTLPKNTFEFVLIESHTTDD